MIQRLTSFFKKLKHPGFLTFLELLALWNFGVTQFLFDLLKPHPEFFFSHQASRMDIIVFGWAIFIIPPCILFILEWLIKRLTGEKAGNVHAIFISLLSAAFTLCVLKKLIAAPGLILLLLAVITGILFSFMTKRVKPVQTFLIILAVLSIAFPILFFMATPIRRAIRDNDSPYLKFPSIHNKPPVVFVVLDELPTTSLMDKTHHIDAKLFPNLAALANTSTWYRNTTTVFHETKYAVPAILAANYPSLNKHPGFHSYPHSLFTFLGGDYKLHVEETLTQLCPDRFCKKESGSFIKQLQSLIADARILYFHILLPEDLHQGLPDVTRTWGGFGDQLQKDFIFRRFVSEITPSKEPVLHFIHIELPHVPFMYVPSGKEYYNNNEERADGLDVRGRIWVENQWVIDQAFQRHLLQLAFTDKLMGELVKKTKETGLYDDALIVVTADHGISFKTGDQCRAITNENYYDIMPVPLFIKYPHQHSARVSDANVQTIDILPTIAKVLETPLPWPVDGRAIDEHENPNLKPKIAYFNDVKFVKYTRDLKKQEETLAKKLALIGKSDSPDDLFNIGPFNKALYHKPASSFSTSNADGFSAYLDSASRFKEIDLKQKLLPLKIMGSLTFPENAKQTTEDLAISVNNVVQCTTTTWNKEKNKARFTCMIPEAALKEGSNTVSIYRIQKDRGTISLSKIPAQTDSQYTLVTEKNSLVLNSSDGKHIPVYTKKGVGRVEAFYRKNRSHRVEFNGVITDAKIAKEIELIVAILPSGKELDALPYSQTPDRKFQWFFPFILLKDQKLRFFVITKSGKAYSLPLYSL